MYSGDSLVGGRRSYSYRTGSRFGRRKGTDKSEQEQDGQGPYEREENKEMKLRRMKTRKMTEVSEAAAAKTAIDKKESASAQFKQMRA